MDHKKWIRLLAAAISLLVVLVLFSLLRGDRDEASALDASWPSVDQQPQTSQRNEVGGGDIWATRASMPTARDQMGAAEANDGKIYAIGGRIGYTFTAAVEVYDPSTDAWATRARLSSARDSLGVVAASNGKIYAIGGYNGHALDAVEEYNPATDTWTTRASMPTARSAMGVVAASNGKIYAIGGSTGYTLTGTVEVYDPTTDTWTTKTSMPTPRCFVAAAEAGNGKIYVVGGRDEWLAYYNAGIDTVEEYDPATDTWATKASMPTQRYGLGVASAPNGKIYAMGGGDVIWFGGYTVYLSSQAVEEYDPATDTWATRADMPTARFWPATVASSRGTIYAIGGSEQYYYSNDVYLDVVEEYTPPDVPSDVANYVYLPLVVHNE